MLMIEQKSLFEVAYLYELSELIQQDIYPFILKLEIEWKIATCKIANPLIEALNQLHQEFPYIKFKNYEF